jgi:uncharacterized protein (DUF2336 family)
MSDRDLIQAARADLAKYDVHHAPTRIGMRLADALEATLDRVAALERVAEAAADDHLFDVCSCPEIHFVNMCVSCLAAIRLNDATAALARLDADGQGTKP